MASGDEADAIIPPEQIGDATEKLCSHMRMIQGAAGRLGGTARHGAPICLPVLRPEGIARRHVVAGRAREGRGATGAGLPGIGSREKKTARFLAGAAARAGGGPRP